MVTHSSILAWRIPWTEKPGGWQSRLQGVVQDRSDLAHKLQFPYPSRGRLCPIRYQDGWREDCKP